MTTLARDSSAEGDLISWWEGDDPESESEVICGMSEAVLFIGDEDDVLQTFGPGRHAVEFPEGAAVAFINTASTRISGEATLEDLDDADMTITARVRVTDAARVIDLLEKLGDDESLEGWLCDELMVHAAAAAEEAGLDTEQMAGNDMLFEQTATRAREVLAEYGIDVQRVESIEISDE